MFALSDRSILLLGLFWVRQLLNFFDSVSLGCLGLGFFLEYRLGLGQHGLSAPDIEVFSSTVISNLSTPSTAYHTGLQRAPVTGSTPCEY